MSRISLQCGLGFSGCLEVKASEGRGCESQGARLLGRCYVYCSAFRMSKISSPWQHVGNSDCCSHMPGSVVSVVAFSLKQNPRKSGVISTASGASAAFLEEMLLLAWYTVCLRGWSLWSRSDEYTRQHPSPVLEFIRRPLRRIHVLTVCASQRSSPLCCS